MTRPRILLTGGSGFIGRNILESPLARGFEIVAPAHREVDFSDTAAVDALFASHRFDFVVHGAGKPGHRNAPDPTGLFYTNTRMYHNLARHAGEVERMLVLGSGAVYDAAHYLPRMPETYFGAHVPRDEHGFYRYVCGRHMESSANIVDLRLFGVFGPREDHCIRFISNLMCKCLFDLPLTMNQDRRFDYLAVEDLAPVLGHFLGRRPPHRAYNVTPDETVSLLGLAHRIREISGKDLPIVVKTPGMGPEYSGDNRRLKAEFPGFAPAPLDLSLPRLYQWISDHRDLIRREDLLWDQ